MNEKKTIIAAISNNSTGRTVFMVIKNGKTFVLDSNDAPKEDAVAIEAAMSLNHLILRKSEKSDRFEGCVKDFEKLVVGI